MSELKLQFEQLAYQQDAVKSAVDVFEGQESCHSNFTIQYKQAGVEQTETGTANRLALKSDKLLDNLHKIQQRNSLRQSEKLGSLDFSIDMETGTGKTFVYLNTIFELNKKYGFSKFIIVVPSIAIKEGVYKSLRNYSV